MEDRETPRMHKYGESKTTRIMVATVRHVTSSSGLRKFQADGFLFVGVYMSTVVPADAQCYVTQCYQYTPEGFSSKDRPKCFSKR